ncbi:hypothetical protein E4U43_005304 [Claviceps pusilla]|uniref:Uncharacterized protein n=1 Tax=Claviceps pusilla TaxID=123648 RepID=A0A9P7N4M6_9HYPO|nr:hypothetical protein E4U43_005304 [Claviceps pusilla]
MDLPPPSYQDAISHGNNPHLPITHHDTLVLDGHTIYTASPPSPFLYQIIPSSSSSASATASGSPPSTYALQKWCFRLPDQDHPDPTTLKSRLHHIYDIHRQTVSLPNSLSLALRPAIKLDGRAGNRHSYREVLLQAGHTGWTTCAATEGWFRADLPLRDRFRRDGRIAWRSRDGLFVAEETRARRGDDKRALPRLAIRAPLREKDLDLLVACWVARVMKQAEGDERDSRECKLNFRFYIIFSFFFFLFSPLPSLLTLLSSSTAKQFNHIPTFNPAPVRGPGQDLYVC